MLLSPPPIDAPDAAAPQARCAARNDKHVLPACALLQARQEDVPMPVEITILAWGMILLLVHIFAAGH